MQDTRFNTPEQAEQAFYEAFAAGDLDRMMAVWSPADYIECIHPMSERLLGISAVRKSWQEIFNPPAKLDIRLSGQRYTTSATLSVHVVEENMTLLETHRRQSLILATNVYELTDAGWRMILHHASPSPQQRESSPSRSDLIH